MPLQTENIPPLEHDTGNDTHPLATLDGTWVRIPDLVRITVEDGLASKDGSTSYDEIVPVGDRWVLEDHLRLETIQPHALTWIDAVSGQQVFWIRANVLGDSSASTLAIVVDEHEPGTPTDPVRGNIRGPQPPSAGRGPTNLLQLSPENLAGPSPARPSRLYDSLRLLNNVQIMELNDADFLGNHLDRVEMILERYELIVDGSLIAQLHDDLCNKVVRSLCKVELIHLTALNHIRQNGCDWPTLKTMLKRRFCSRVVLTAAFRSRITRLQLKTVALIDDFLTEATSLYTLLSQIYGAEHRSEMRQLVEEVLTKLPEWLRRTVIRRMVEITPSGMDWETYLPFTLNSKTGAMVSSFCSVIEDEARIANSSFHLGTQTNPSQKSIVDRVHLLETNSEPRINHQWILRGNLPTTEELTIIGFIELSRIHRSANGRSFQFGNSEFPLETLLERAKAYPDLSIQATKRKNLQ
jgi:hypothetical protein